jgi:acyl-homoserine-lactone acylase
MRFWWQILSVATVLTFVFGLPGCGPQKPAQQTPPPESTVPAQQPATTELQKPEAAPQGEKVTIYRDTWGVPHIYADTEAGATYGLGYAMAEDRLDDLFKNIRTAIGRSAEIDPDSDNIQSDYFMQVLENEKKCEEYYNAAPEIHKAIADGFTKGVLAYINEHPENHPESFLDIKPWHSIAIGRTMILRWPIGTIMDDLRGSKNFNGFASNEWAVAPSRSADNCSILLTDPHLTWEGLAVFYEAHISGGTLHTAGFHLLGSPLVGLGHNEYVGWAATTGGPDTSDVYAVKLHKGGAPNEYEYDGEVRKAEIRFIKINVKDKAPEQRPALITHLGPAVSQPDLEKGVIFVGASPYFETVDLFKQTYGMVTAKNCDEFYAALGMNCFMEQNVMFADRDGNIQYVRTGRVPIRPEGYKWDAPVPGDTSKSQWLGIHDIKDLVQIKNPPQGYMQNCNISPLNMMKDSTLSPDKYKDYIYNVSWDNENQRSRNSRELLDSDPRITKEKALAIAMNIDDILAGPWKTALKSAVDAAGTEKMKDPVFAAGVNDILQWHGRFQKDSTAATLVKFWRLKCEAGGIDVEAIFNGTPLPADQHPKMLDLLSAAQADLKASYGKEAVAWGEVHVIGRGGQYFPVDGAEFGGGPKKSNESETLLDVKAEGKPDEKGRLIANNGSMSMMLMFFHKEGIDSRSCYMWGQSSDPASPHYLDQAEKLYTQQKMKPTWFNKDDLLKNTESEKVLTYQ